MPSWFATAAKDALPALVGSIGNIAGGLFGQGRAYKYNKNLAAYQHKKNMELLKFQLDYNSPANQMSRFAEAGLNPNLVYTQGDAGNMSQPAKYPEMAQMSPEVFGNLGTQFAQMMLMRSQTRLTNTKVDESTSKKDLNKAQKAVAEANPWLNKAYVEAIVLQLSSAAKIKEQEMQFLTMGQVDIGTHRGEAGMVKMKLELDNLAAKFRLNQEDQKIRAKIVESKEFQNALQEIQLKWMKDKEITPQHIYQGIMMLLSKMM